MNRDREKENDDSIVANVVVVADSVPIADVQSMALSFPDQLPVLLQGHPIAATTF